MYICIRGTDAELLHVAPTLQERSIHVLRKRCQHDNHCPLKLWSQSTRVGVARGPRTHFGAERDPPQMARAYYASNFNLPDTCIVFIFLSEEKLDMHNF